MREHTATDLGIREAHPQLEAKGILDYTCSTCRRFITPAEGGIRCRNCNHLFCCHHECIPVKYCNDATYPGGVKTCPKCKGVPIPKQRKKLEEATTEIIKVHPVQTPLERMLSQQLGRTIVAPPPRHGQEEKQEKPEKPKKMDKRLIGYYDL